MESRINDSNGGRGSSGSGADEENKKLRDNE